MATDIVTTLQLDKELSGRVIAVKEIINCDSSFIISCVLSHCIKNKSAVILISLHKSLSHYQNVGIKMNYSLQKNIDAGFIIFCDLGAEYADKLMKNQDIPIVCLLSKVNETIVKMQEKYETVNIILDGITHLFDMNYNLSEVNSFCNEIIKNARHIKKSFLLFHCNVASDDDISNVMSNLLSHKSDILLEVENLPSGWSADVSGHLAMKYIGRKFEDEHDLYSMDLKFSKYLFKLFDRGVKLMAPGTV
ncbi:elongator complex protein 6 [Plodia interpunctella]|uniref:elongator complex protein 6 n=1 Tax=Plodia interpunctella TaxID=58824 RepID=UPI0023676023|nr:elongator complex protein 6 [Plodia interpunctella]XP_053607620.1 elongator complex protein 6 [Plodia interpunctella]XP_053607622.1 elongator complex protein 6 [Plodia interpunctella]